MSEHKTTAQEIFDKTAEHLFKQGARAWLSDAQTCAYRGEGGTKCAVGFWIKNKDYRERMEMNGVTSLKSMYPNNPSVRGLVDSLGLFSKLQFVHDVEWHWDDTESMQEALQSVAETWNLSMSYVSTLKFADR